MTRKLTAKQHRFIAAYLGEAEGNATEAARLAGYAGTAATLAAVGYDNLRKPQIAAAIREALEQIDCRGIAIKQYRINAKAERWLAMRAIRLARAEAFRQELDADPSVALPPGWEQGFHVRQIKAIPAGRGETTIIEEFALDATMLREFTSLEKEIAQELGQIESSVRVRHSGQVQHDHRFSGHDDLDMLSVEELELLAAIREKLDAGLVES